MAEIIITSDQFQTIEACVGDIKKIKSLKATVET